MWENALLLVFFSLLLVLSGVILVRNLTKIAEFLRMTEFVIGFIVMAVATSIPELFVGISGALQKKTGLVLGTIIGSNIVDLTLIAGISIVLVKGFNIESEKTKVDSLYMVVLAALPIVLTLFGGALVWYDGLILIFAFFLYAFRLFRQRKVFRKELKEPLSHNEVIGAVFLFLFALVVLFISSHFLVHYANILAFELNVAPILIGLIVIAIGTSLPELVFQTRAVLSGHTEIALGDIIGAVVVNSTLVLGITALIFPITSDFVLFLTSGVFMIIVAFIFATFVESGNRLYLKEGLALIMLYVFFIIIEFYIKIVVNGGIR